MPPPSAGSATAHCVSMYMCCWLGSEYLRMQSQSFSQSFIQSAIHSFITRLPTRRLGALQQPFYGGPPACPVLGVPPPCEHLHMQSHSFIHNTPSDLQIGCVAAAILWQPSSLPCLGSSSTM